MPCHVLCLSQLVDDVLDFTSCANQLGKPSAADLRLGLATGPVLFACEQVRQAALHVPATEIKDLFE